MIVKYKELKLYRSPLIEIFVVLLGNPQHTLQMVIAVLFNRICNFYRIQFYYCANFKNIDIASQN